MRVYLICFSLIGVFWTGAEEENLPTEQDSPPPTKLVTKKGKVYYNWKVKRVETDALTIEHSKGIARVSFFELDEKMREEHGFDPVEALKKYKLDQKRKREEKWKRFWERQKFESVEEEKKERESLVKTAKTDWMPVEATVIRRDEKGAYVRAKKIKFVPTTVKSTLGFDVEGPPRKTLVRMTPDVIFIQTTEFSGVYWKGYLEPFPMEMVPHPYLKDNVVPSYRAVARTEIK